MIDFETKILSKADQSKGPAEPVMELEALEKLAKKQQKLGLGDCTHSVEAEWKQRIQWCDIKKEKQTAALERMRNMFDELTLTSEYGTRRIKEFNKMHKSNERHRQWETADLKMDDIEGIPLFNCDGNGRSKSPCFNYRHWHHATFPHDLDAPPEWAAVVLSDKTQGIVAGASKQAIDKYYETHKRRSAGDALHGIGFDFVCWTAPLALIPSTVQELAKRALDTKGKMDFVLVYQPEWQNAGVNQLDPALLAYMRDNEYSNPDHWFLIAQWGKDQPFAV